MITETPQTNILLVDDSPSVRQALRWLLEESPEYCVVGEAADGDTAVQLCQELLPDVIVLDVELPDTNGFRVTSLLKAAIPTTQIIMLSGHGDSATRQLAVEVGADGFIEKSEGWQALLQALADVVQQKSKTINETIN